MWTKWVGPYNGAYNYQRIVGLMNTAANTYASLFWFNLATSSTYPDMKLDTRKYQNSGWAPAAGDMYSSPGFFDDDTTWVHVVLTCTATDIASGAFSWYIDGVLDVTEALGTLYEPACTNLTFCTDKYDGSGSSMPHTAKVKLNNTTVWSRGLTAAEVMERP